MMSNLIQWPRAQYWDKPWNPIVGCKPCSPACENCYAASMMRRFSATDFSPRKTTRVNPPRKGVVFCGNMTDLFGEWEDSPMDYIAKTAKAAHKNAIYLYLTKRVRPMCSMLGAVVIGCPYTNPKIFSNHYFGFTAENQEWYDRRRDAIYDKWPPWANLWLSCEPLLGDINLKAGNVAAGRPLSWLVVGCESGPNRRPCKLEWVESIVDQCRAANVPVFIKQLDLNSKCERDISKFPEHLRIRQVPWAKEGASK